MYYSQYGQDEFLEKNIFKGKREKIFLDIGAYDGVSYSNSYFFEKERGWKGICIEPNPQIYSKLKEIRNCICVNACVSQRNGKMTYMKVTGYAEMLSGLVECFDAEHLERIDREIKEFGGTKTLIEVDSIVLNDLLNEKHLLKIDYCNIDTEGNELSIIRSIDFNKIQISVFSIENNSDHESIKSYLEKYNYEHLSTVGTDDIYIRQGPLIFYWHKFKKLIKSLIRRIIPE